MLLKTYIVEITMIMFCRYLYLQISYMLLKMSSICLNHKRKMLSCLAFLQNKFMLSFRCFQTQSPKGWDLLVQWILAVVKVRRRKRRERKETLPTVVDWCATENRKNMCTQTLEECQADMTNGSLNIIKDTTVVRYNEGYATVVQ